MAEKNLNRIKVMLAEKGKTNKWLAEKLGRDQATISKWCTNACQPPLEALIQISQCLEVDIKELGCPVRCSEKQMLKSPVKLLI